MCDEYDDERMRAFWRQLAQQGGVADLEIGPESRDESVLTPAVELVDPKRAKSRALTR